MCFPPAKAESLIRRLVQNLSCGVSCFFFSQTAIVDFHRPRQTWAEKMLFECSLHLVLMNVQALRRPNQAEGGAEKVLGWRFGFAQELQPKHQAKDCALDALGQMGCGVDLAVVGGYTLFVFVLEESSFPPPPKENNTPKPQEQTNTHKK